MQNTLYIQNTNKRTNMRVNKWNGTKIYLEPAQLTGQLIVKQKM